MSGSCPRCGRSSATSSRHGAPPSSASSTQVYTNEGGSGAPNLEVNLRLHGSELELQRVPVAAGRHRALGGAAGRRSRRRSSSSAAISTARSCSAPSTTTSATRPKASARRGRLRGARRRGRGDRRIEVQLPSGNTAHHRGHEVTVTMGAHDADGRGRRGRHHRGRGRPGARRRAATSPSRRASRRRDAQGRHSRPRSKASGRRSSRARRRRSPGRPASASG